MKRTFGELWYLLFSSVVFSSFFPLGDDPVFPDHFGPSVVVRLCLFLLGLSGLLATRLWGGTRHADSITFPAADAVFPTTESTPPPSATCNAPEIHEAGTVTLRYNMTRADYLRSSLNSLKIAIPIAIGLSLSMFGTAVQSAGPFLREHNIPAYALLVAILAGMSILLGGLVWSGMRRKFPSPDSIQHGVTTISREGIYDVMPDKTVLSEWLYINQIRVHRGDVYIRTPGNGCFIPRSAFKGEAAAQEFCAVITRVWKSLGADLANVDLQPYISHEDKSPGSPALRPQTPAPLDDAIVRLVRRARLIGFSGLALLLVGNLVLLFLLKFTNSMLPTTLVDGDVVRFGYAFNFFKMTLLLFPIPVSFLSVMVWYSGMPGSKFLASFGCGLAIWVGIASIECTSGVRETVLTSDSIEDYSRGWFHSRSQRLVFRDLELVSFRPIPIEPGERRFSELTSYRMIGIPSDEDRPVQIIDVNDTVYAALPRLLRRLSTHGITVLGLRAGGRLPKDMYPGWELNWQVDDEPLSREID